jgi:hypothetical protein
MQKEQRPVKKIDRTGKQAQGKSIYIIIPLCIHDVSIELF